MFQSPSGDSLFSDPYFGMAFRPYQAQAFQSPSGDSLFSDPHQAPQQNQAWRLRRFQSPSGDSLFSDVSAGVTTTAPPKRFQSPSGDSLFSDLFVLRKILDNTLEGFNPLAGIRCFLTPSRRQLPAASRTIGFNPLAGIRCFLTLHAPHLSAPLDWPASFNPLAGIRCFLTVDTPQGT